MLLNILLAPKPLHKNISGIKKICDFNEENLIEDDINVLLDS